MATLTFHPAVLTAALHAGSAAARLAATTTDPDGGGVAIASQPDGSLTITSGTPASFSRAYADPADDTDPDGAPLPPLVMGLHSVAGFRRHLAQCDPTDRIELRADPVGVSLIKNGWLNLTSASNRAGALTPWTYTDQPALALNAEIPAHLTELHRSLAAALDGHGHPDPEDTLEVYVEAEAPHGLSWHLGDWALGHTDPR